jgi:ribosome assembly protein YihI (activator of Der GTPase)
MPTFTHETKSRYRTPKQQRNEPRDDWEKEIQLLEVNQQIEKLLDRFPNEKVFHEALAVALAKRVLPTPQETYTPPEDGKLI